MSRSGSERGAVLVQAAIALLVLIGFTTFVIDYGVLWVARNQAQTAADAGALAGAIGLAYDDTTYPPTVNPDLIKISASRAALCASGSSGCTSTEWAANPNPVWPAQSGASAAVDVLFECPPQYAASEHCVRVNVYRNGEGNGFIPGPSSMLPTFFGPLLSIQSQGVKATASARVAAANATDCLRPFAIPDSYWDMDGDGVFTPGTDIYTPPTSDDIGTGYAPGYNLGDEVIFKDDEQISSGNFRLLDLSGDVNGTSGTSKVIKACTPDVYAIGDALPSKKGNSTGIEAALDAVFALDPAATWDTDQKKIVNSCVDTHSCYRYVWNSGDPVLVPDPTATVSPRVLALPLYDPQIEAQSLANNGTDDLEVVNFIGFFYTSLDTLPSKAVHGRIVTLAGLNVQTGGSRTVSAASAFLKGIQLIR